MSPTTTTNNTAGDVLCPKCHQQFTHGFKLCTACRLEASTRLRNYRRARRELGGNLPGFARQSSVGGTKTSRTAEQLLDAIVRAIRDGKNGQLELMRLVRLYPVVQRGQNPYRVLFDEIDRLNSALRGTQKELTNGELF